MRLAYWTAEGSDDPDADLGALCDRETELRIKLLTTAPASIAGCAALLRHIGEHAANTSNGDGLYSGWYEPGSEPAAVFLHLVADAIERMTGQS